MLLTMQVVALDHPNQYAVSILRMKDLGMKYTEQNIALVMELGLIIFCISADIMRKYHG